MYYTFYFSFSGGMALIPENFLGNASLKNEMAHLSLLVESLDFLQLLEKKY
jgi:hypothetical protein